MNIEARAYDAIRAFQHAKRDQQLCHVTFTPDSLEADCLIARGTPFDLTDLASFLVAADVPFSFSTDRVLTINLS